MRSVSNYSSMQEEMKRLGSIETFNRAYLNRFGMVSGRVFGIAVYPERSRISCFLFVFPLRLKLEHVTKRLKELRLSHFKQ